MTTTATTEEEVAQALLDEFDSIGLDEVDRDYAEHCQKMRQFIDDYRQLQADGKSEEELRAWKKAKKKELDVPRRYIAAYCKYCDGKEGVVDAVRKGDSDTAQVEAKKADVALEEIFKISPELKKAFSELTKKVEGHETRLNNHEGRLKALEEKFKKQFEESSAPRPAPAAKSEPVSATAKPGPRHAATPQPQAKDDDATREFDAVDDEEKEDIGPFKKFVIKTFGLVPDNRYPEGYKRPTA